MWTRLKKLKKEFSKQKKWFIFILNRILSGWSFTLFPEFTKQWFKSPLWLRAPAKETVFREPQWKLLRGTMLRPPVTEVQVFHSVKFMQSPYYFETQRCLRRLWIIPTVWVLLSYGIASGFFTRNKFKPLKIWLNQLPLPTCSVLRTLFTIYAIMPGPGNPKTNTEVMKKEIQRKSQQFA